MWVVGDLFVSDSRKMRHLTCSVCGYKCTRRVNLLQIETRCKTCGMIDRNRKTFGKHRGAGDLSLTFFNYFRHVAHRRSIPFELTVDALWDLFQQQGARCALSGLPLSMPVGTTIGGAATLPDSPSLDRKDSTRGYVPGNVQWVHKCVNVMKNSLPQETFIAFCRAVAENSPTVEVSNLQHYGWKSGVTADIEPGDTNVLA